MYGLRKVYRSADGEKRDGGEAIMDKIYSSIAELLKPRSVITLMVFGTACILALTVQPIPVLIDWGCRGLFGFWFAEKTVGLIKGDK